MSNTEPAGRPLAVRGATQGIAFLAIALACGAYSIYRGQDASWDLKNYHYYVPFASVHGRLMEDVAPAGMQSFHHPGLDYPFYFLVSHFNDHPKVVSFLMAFPTAVAIALLVLLSLKVAGREQGRWAPAAFCVLMGVCGAAGISQWGTTTNEWPLAALAIGALCVVMRALDRGGLTARDAMIAGLVCGVGAGLKLTAVTACVAMAGAFLLLPLPLRERLRAAFTFGLASLAGFAAAAGAWMAGLYESFSNPLFPYFNSIFQSPWWAPQEIVTRVFGPKSWSDAILFPLAMLKRNSLASEPYLRDWHLPILYASGLLFALALPARRALGATQAPMNAMERFLLTYAGIFYLLWLAVHSIYRYLIPLELISGCVLLVLWRRTVPWRLWPVFAVVLVVVWATKINASWGRVPFGERFFDVASPALPAGTLVLIASDKPLAYVVPGFPRDSRFVGINNNIIRPGLNTHLNQRAADVIAGHRGEIFLLDQRGKEQFGALPSYSLRRSDEPCVELRSNMDSGGLSLCRVLRASMP